MMLKESVLFISLLICISAQEKDNPNPNPNPKRRIKLLKKAPPCHLKSLDQCMTKMFHFSNRMNSTGIATTEEEFDYMCKASHLVIKCTDQFFQKCSFPIHRDIYEIGKEQFLQSFKRLCDHGPIRERYIKYAPCVNEIKLDSKYRKKCVHNLQVALDIVAEKQSIFEAVNVGCCAFNDWEDCFNNMIEQKCGSDGKNAVVNIIDIASGNMIHQICLHTNYDPKSEFCKSNLPAPGTVTKRKDNDSFLSKYFALVGQNSQH